MGEFNTVTGSAHTVTNTYDPDRSGGILLTKANTRNSDQSAISSVNYIVNTLGQREERTTTDAANNSATTEWTYDALGQVTSEDQPGTTTDRAYQYDHIGNRKKSANSLTLPATDNYTSNALNQYTGITSGQLTSEPQYDFDGNMTHGPHPADPTVPALFFYDAENRLLEIRNATTGVTLQRNHYDVFSRRIASTINGVTTIYLYDAWNVIAEWSADLQSASLTKTNLWGRDLSNTMQGAGGVGGLLMTSLITNNSISNNFFPLYDGNGNVTEYIDQTGAVTVHFEYDAFGNTTNRVTNNPITNNLTYRFSSKPLDATTGLYYYGYRFYDPRIGRWLNRDPIAEKGGFNLYGFVRNNQINKIDIIGLSENCDGSWEVALNDLINWTVGDTDPAITYGSNSQQNQYLRSSDSVQKLRSYFLNKNKKAPCKEWEGVTNYAEDFKPWDSNFWSDMDNGVMQFVGSFSAEIRVISSTTTSQTISTRAGAQICEETRIRVEFSISNPTTIASLLRYVDFGTGIIVDDSWNNDDNTRDYFIPGDVSGDGFRDFGATWKQTYEWIEVFFCQNCKDIHGCCSGQYDETRPPLR
jgi:RHS repeat-associated protein